VSGEAASAAALIEAIAAAAREAAGETRLVSFAFEPQSAAAPARVEARIERKTRTLVFASAEAFDADGLRIATASAVHHIKDNGASS
jgi:hypothetical protein